MLRFLRGPGAEQIVSLPVFYFSNHLLKEYDNCRIELSFFIRHLWIIN